MAVFHLQPSHEELISARNAATNHLFVEFLRKNYDRDVELMLNGNDLNIERARGRAQALSAVIELMDTSAEKVAQS